jgi:hypothetical protein
LFLFHGSKRHEAATKLHDFDVVLTTYDTLRSDWTSCGPLYNRTWARVILDEGTQLGMKCKGPNPYKFFSNPSKPVKEET